MALQLERAREFGVLRAQGVTPGQVRRPGARADRSDGRRWRGPGAAARDWCSPLVLVFVINRALVRLDAGAGRAGAHAARGRLALGVGAALLAGAYPAWRMSRRPAGAGAARRLSDAPRWAWIVLACRRSRARGRRRASEPAAPAPALAPELPALLGARAPAHAGRLRARPRAAPLPLPRRPRRAPGASAASGGTSRATSRAPTAALRLPAHLLPHGARARGARARLGLGDAQVVDGPLRADRRRGRRFQAFERLSREALGLAGARRSRSRCWRRRLVDARLEGAPFPLRAARRRSEPARARPGDRRAEPLVLQGDRGLSRKGSAPGNASYYYSFHAPRRRAGTVSPAARRSRSRARRGSTASGAPARWSRPGRLGLVRRCSSTTGAS